MAQHTQEPPKADVLIVCSQEQDELAQARSFNAMSEQFLKKMEERIALYDSAKKERDSFEQCIQGVIKNHTEIKECLEGFKKAKQENLEKHRELKETVTTLQTNLKNHETATLENTKAMLGHTESIKNTLAEYAVQIKTLQDQMQIVQQKQDQDPSATPRVRDVVESEQARNSTLEENLRNLTEKFNNLIKNRTSLDNEQKQRQEALDEKLVQDQAAKQATLNNILKQLDTLKTAINNQDDANQTLLRKIQLCMTGSIAALLASVWIWWQAHRA